MIKWSVRCILWGVVLMTSLSLAQEENTSTLSRVILRNIGHQFLLEIGDSTSRILPITQKDKSYVLSFDQEFAFDPEQLYTKVHEVMYTYNVLQNFIVDVISCDSNLIVYSFRASINSNEAILNCKERPLPKGCYQIVFTATEGWTPPAFTKEQAPEKGQKEASNYLWILLLFPLLGFLWWKFKKREKVEEALVLGLYKFDLKRMKLFYKDEVIELSSLEADLLHLFIQHKNETLKREFILNEVWEDEGNYVGRTLDVFISKLRKKLEKDETLKIVSVRGVGYKFVN
ncbi:Transcriptional regulatory protein, C terminal [Lishizhenia tianjinensis]|uniref:Transcriptional regulatory protein, C terminal n=1 Tax=Lishizhenia tianjinensis TaxID=477690 RepID=A0A1I7B1U2_9FLAO|nr:response regulator transcription factor [Lishizhenia tianjinensis]SFT81147.1 Transcriptional regulatory protein, C terminal [Lishizhenia tianjinensis]